MSIPPPRENLYPTLPITAPSPQRENLYPTLPITAPSPPNSRLAKTYHSLSAQARLRMLEDLQKHRDERCKKPSTNSKTTSSLTTPNNIPLPPARGTSLYCTRRKNRFGVLRECKCGFDHDIVHPSEWRGTPAEAAWDYSVGVKNGGWGARERKVRFREPVVTYVDEGEEERGRGAEREGEGEGEVEESEEEESEEEDDGEEEKWVMVGRWTWNWGVVDENPDEEMEDAFEELDPSIYLGTGVLEDADTPCRH